MSEDALGTRISGGISSMRVGLSRMMLGWVGVKIGVKDVAGVGRVSHAALLGMTPAYSTHVIESVTPSAAAGTSLSAIAPSPSATPTRILDTLPRRGRMRPVSHPDREPYDVTGQRA